MALKIGVDLLPRRRVLELMRWGAKWRLYEQKGRGLSEGGKVPPLLPCGPTGRDDLSFKSSRRKKRLALTRNSRDLRRKRGGGK